MLNSSPCFLTPKLLQPNYPLFVFLPGMDGTGQLLRTQTDGLEAGFDVRCLAIPPTELTNWDDLAEQVIRLTHAELKQTPRAAVYLCGESFGGCLAMKVALHAPGLFNRVILVNPASSFRQRPWLSLGGPVTSWIPEPLYQVSTLSLLPWLANLDRITPGDRKALLTAMRSVPQKTSVWRLSLLSQFAVSEAQLKTLTQPVLLIASAADRLLPSVPEAQQLAQSLPNAHIVTLPNSGHTCLLEKDLNLYEILQAHNFLMSEPAEKS